MNCLLKYLRYFRHKYLLNCLDIIANTYGTPIVNRVLFYMSNPPLVNLCLLINISVHLCCLVVSNSL